MSKSVVFDPLVFDPKNCNSYIDTLKIRINDKICKPAVFMINFIIIIIINPIIIINNPITLRLRSG